MDIFLNIVILIFGAFILIKAADFFVDSSSAIARKLKISPLIIGLTIVALGTSLPELAVSITSAIKAEATADLAMGNIIGSNITNITLILGISALFAPIVAQKKVIKRDGIFLVISAMLFLVFGLFFQSDKKIVWWEALILLLVCITYFIVLIKTSKEELIHDEPTVIQDNEKPYSYKTIIFLLVGIVGIALGAEMVTRPAQYLAEMAAISFGLDASLATTLVGLTVVAIGTSLPELATAITAARKKQNEIVLGNVIGSNILNVLFIVGTTGLITPLGINKAIAFDLIIMVVITLIAFLFMLKKSVSKLEGSILLIIYVLYIAFAIWRTIS